jgi:signal transduction histidine kinase
LSAPRGSIRQKLVTAMMLTSTTVVILTGAALIIYDTISSRQSLTRRLTTQAEILAANSTAALAFENTDDARQLLSGLKSDPSAVMAALYDRRGQLFALYPADAPASMAPAAPGKVGSRFESQTLVIIEPVEEDGRMLGTLYLKSDLRALTVRRRVFALVVLLAAAGSVAVAFVLANWLQSGIAGPVRLLANAAEQVAQGRDYSVRAKVASDDELGLLSNAFNGMLGEIQQRDAALRASEASLRQLNSDLERRVQARTAELQVSNRELEAFSYSVSHDLRAPLRHVDGFADLLTRHAGPSLDDKSRRYLATISDSAKSMGVLIDDLLSFSRMGRSEMQHAHVSLREMVAEVRQGMSSDLTGREIVWEIGDLPDVVGDAAMLRAALTNLLSNAVKYTRGRSPARISIGVREENDEIVLYVRDNGAGFDMAYQDKLFGVFQRLHSAEEFEGTGIGLANVRRIVQRHGGRVWAEGKVGEGAAFFIALPRAGSAQAQHEEAA